MNIEIQMYIHLRINIKCIAIACLIGWSCDTAAQHRGASGLSATGPSVE